MPKREPLEVRFWKYVSRDLPDRCWAWTGATRENGYGQIGDDFDADKGPTSPLAAHRVSWEINNGPIPEDMFVLHRCDNRNCVNPAHLFLGTQEDNVQDMVNKKRAYWQTHPEEFRDIQRRAARLAADKLRDRPRPARAVRLRVGRRGENNPNHKLTNEQVRDIRERRVRGGSLRSIAHEYGVNESSISRIANREKWSHL